MVRNEENAEEKQRQQVVSREATIFICKFSSWMVLVLWPESCRTSFSIFSKWTSFSIFSKTLRKDSRWWLNDPECLYCWPSCAVGFSGLIWIGFEFEKKYMYFFLKFSRCWIIREKRCMTQNEKIKNNNWVHKFITIGISCSYSFYEGKLFIFLSTYIHYKICKFRQFIFQPLSRKEKREWESFLWFY